MPFISINSNQIFYEEINSDSSSNDVIIFLHEALGSVAQWRSFPEELCNKLGYKGIVYERLGYGKSDPNPDIRTERYLENAALEELPEIINSLISEDDNIHLVGHSDGGSIALVYGNNDERIKSITTMAAHIFVEDVTLEGIHPAIEAYNQGKLIGLTKYHGDKTEKLFFDWAHTWLADFYLDWNIEKYLKDIVCPVFAIQGEEDQYGTVKQVDGIVNQLAGASSKLIIPDCGHAPHLDKKDTVVNEITTFIKSVE